MLGDKGMLYSRFVIGRFNEPECICPDHRNFNYQLARLRVKPEHAIGILKGPWRNLKEMRLWIATDCQFAFAMWWIMACIALHNVCVEEGEGFPEQPVPGPSLESAFEPVAGAFPRRQQILVKMCVL